MIGIHLKRHPGDNYTTLLDEDATIEVQSDDTAGRLVITFSNGNVVIRTQDARPGT